MKRLVIVRHRYGDDVDIYPVWVTGSPTRDELQQAAIKTFDIDFEPHRGEFIEIDDIWGDDIKTLQFE